MFIKHRFTMVPCLKNCIMVNRKNKKKHGIITVCSKNMDLPRYHIEKKNTLYYHGKKNKNKKKSIITVYVQKHGFTMLLYKNMTTTKHGTITVHVPKAWFYHCNIPKKSIIYHGTSRNKTILWYKSKKDGITMIACQNSETK